MDTKRFDGAIRLFAGSRSRRSALTQIGAIALAGVFGQAQVAAKRDRPAIKFTKCTTADSAVNYVDGPSDKPKPGGAARFKIGADGASEFAHLRTRDFAGQRLDDLEVLKYATYVRTQAQCDSGQAPYIILRINFTGGTSVDDIILYEPFYNGTVACREWQTWDAADPGGRWWSPFTGSSTFFTLAEYLADHPDATLVNAESATDCPKATGGLRIATGEGAPWSDATTFVNYIRVGFAGKDTKQVVF